MKYLLILIAVPSILILSYGGCSNECTNCIPGLPSNCTNIQDLVDSDCLGDTLALSCFGMTCETDPVVIIGNLIIDCAPIDCNSIECGDTVLTDLVIDEENAQISTTVIENGEELGNAGCLFFQP